MKRFLKINAADNVAVALADDLHEGETLDVEGVAVTLREDVARGHKFALRDIAAGENVVKYGYPIGHATQDVPQGGWIHTHNLKTNLRDDLEYTYAPKVYDVGCPKRDVRVMGYLRGNDTMGIRNELWIVPSVGCVNGQAQAIAERVKRECDCSHLDDVRVYTHNYGCSQLGDDHANTQRALAALVRHPNAGAVLVLGLGCENNQVSALKEVIGQWDDERVKFLVAQEVEDEIEAGFEICRGLVEKTKADKRQPLPLAYLKVGLKCGGSDGFSGTLNDMYLKKDELDVQLLGRGFAWLDTGTMESLVDAADFVRMVEKRQGIKISAPEEIAFKYGWIDRETLLTSAERYGKSPYGQHLKNVADGKLRY